MLRQVKKFKKKKIKPIILKKQNEKKSILIKIKIEQFNEAFNILFKDVNLSKVLIVTHHHFSSNNLNHQSE